MRQLHQAPETLFWYWVNERHRIFVARAAGRPRPWTEDPILQTYKFTNVFRQLDRGTVWLTERFVQPHWDGDQALLVFNVAWYRMFNWTGTGELLGWRRSWRSGAISRLLHSAQDAGGQIFTGAHIVWSEGGQPKIDGVLSSCAALWKARRHLVAIAHFSRSLEAVFNELLKVRGVGPFIAYEIVTDLRHTPVLNCAHDINWWANVGPGALRGLRRLDPAMRPSDALGKMRALLMRSRDERDGVLGGHVPPLELRDIEHSLCEWDKYCRVRFSEGRPRATYNGKAEAA